MKNISFTFLLLLVFSVGCVTAQPQPNSGSSSKKATALFDEAVKYLSYRDFQEALKLTEQALDKDEKYIDAWDLKSEILDKMGREEEAFAAAERCIKINADYSKGYLILAELALKYGKYKEAVGYSDKFLSYSNIPDTRKRFVNDVKYKAQFALDQLNHPVDFTPINLGPNINTKEKDYAPSLTVDNKQLIFSRSIGRQEDFYISQRKNMEWGMAIHPSYPLNTPENESFPSFTADGKYVFFARFVPQDAGNCDIWFSQFNGVSWDEPRNLGPKINTRGWESQPCISADGSTLYFLAVKQGGLGNSDIYKSVYKAGSWSEPINLGPNINSPGNEEAPFIHPDGKTFYFSSDGRPGMGNFDLYKSTMKDDGSFTEAVGLGYPINTKEDERWLTVSSNAVDAYFVSSGLKGEGDWDIFTFKLPESARPKPVTYVKGRVFNAVTKEPMKAKVEVTDLATGKINYVTISNKSSGEMLACLISGANYAFNISADGFAVASENYVVDMKAGIDSPILKDFYLQPITKGGKFVLKNIFFETGKFELKKESFIELDRLVEILKNNPKLTIEVGGHTDNVGVRKSNITLSENRAKAVFDYLVSKGIVAARLTNKGYGDLSPIADNNTDAGRAENRRTEFTITGN
ncbi:MAG: PD40 domain-containing protein [Bacteroidetes bacterium]|nr:PD40 domain-containing protein [Bacteroidota bacterium]